MLIADATGKSTAWVIAHGDEEIDDGIESLFERRLRGEPLQYIREKTEFYGREFYVDNRVLIPRPETELLVEAVIKRAPKDARVIDVGTGSGCIAVSIAAARPDLRVFACDISPAALAVAKRNGARRLFASDVLAAVRVPFDIIVSNAPYIAEADVITLATEVRDHEPYNALTPGPLGTEVIEEIMKSAPFTARLFLEIGYGQSDQIFDLARRHQYRAEIENDLAGIPRIALLTPTQRDRGPDRAGDVNRT